ncbi:hypothetical protein [Nostoc sp.]
MLQRDNQKRSLELVEFELEQAGKPMQWHNTPMQWHNKPMQWHNTPM